MTKIDQIFDAWDNYTKSFGVYGARIGHKSGLTVLVREHAKTRLVKLGVRPMTGTNSWSVKGIIILPMPT